MKKILKIVGGIVAALLVAVIIALLIVVIRTRLTQNDYSRMPLFMKMGFAIGMFEKNTIFSVE